MPILPLALRAAAAHVPVHEAPSVPDEFIARTQPDNVRRDLHRLVQLKGMQRLLYPRLVVEQHVTIDQSHILHIRDCGHAYVLQVFFAPTNRVGPQPYAADSFSGREVEWAIAVGELDSRQPHASGGHALLESLKVTQPRGPAQMVVIDGNDI
jgi:hypothetical protein